MVSVLKPIIGIWAMTLASAMAIDFTPHQVVSAFDGAKLSHLVFADDLFDVTYSPPRGWICQGTGNVLILRNPQKDQADAKIVALQTPLSFQIGRAIPTIMPAS